MSQENGIKTRRDLETAVIKRALKDDAYRQELFANPRAAVSRLLTESAPGATLPAGLEVKTIQEPTNALYLIIPHVAPIAELSDADLERVAGGAVSVDVSVGWSA